MFPLYRQREWVLSHWVSWCTGMFLQEPGMNKSSTGSTKNHLCYLHFSQPPWFSCLLCRGGWVQLVAICALNTGCYYNHVCQLVSYNVRHLDSRHFSWLPLLSEHLVHVKQTSKTCTISCATNACIQSHQANVIQNISK